MIAWERPQSIRRSGAFPFRKVAQCRQLSVARREFPYEFLKSIAKVNKLRVRMGARGRGDCGSGLREQSGLGRIGEIDHFRLPYSLSMPLFAHQHRFGLAVDRAQHAPGFASVQSA